MMGGTITALVIQERNKERVNVFLDDEFAFGLSMIDAARLRKGQYLTDSEIKTLKESDAVEKAYERGLRFLAQRPRSAVEIRRHLLDKGVEETAAAEALERLIGQGYVDDLAFARYWLSNRQQFRPRGTRALRFELREKGIEQAIIDEVLADLDTDEAAYEAAKDKAKRFRGYDKRAFKEKVGSFLVRRGFDYNTVRDALERLMNDLQEEDADFFKGEDTGDNEE